MIGRPIVLLNCLASVVLPDPAHPIINTFLPRLCISSLQRTLLNQPPLCLYFAAHLTGDILP